MHSSAATAAAEPPLEPPGIRSRSQGFRVTPKKEVSVEEPMANSSMFVLPGEDGARRPELLHDGRVVGRDEIARGSGSRRSSGPPCVQKMSFRAMGMPVSGPISPFLIFSSAACRLGEGRLPHQGDVGADILFHGVDPSEDGGGDLGGGGLPRPELVLQVREWSTRTIP